jgi:hypothetical protein
MSRLISTAFALGLMLLPATAAEAMGTRTFRDWNVVCDNSNTCVAFAFPAEGGGETAWLRLERGGDAGAPVRAVIAVYAEDDLVAGGGPWTVKVDGKPIPGLDALAPIQDGTGFWRADIPASGTRALAIAARDGSVLTLSRKAREPVTLSLAGGGATMIWIDEQQGRLGSPTALSRAAGRPTAIAVPALPVVKAGPAISQEGLPKAVPPGVMAVLEDCEDAGDWHDEQIIARLAPGVVLYAPVCSRGAYNAVYSLVLADEKGRGARRVILPSASGSPEADVSDPMNIDYSLSARILVSFSKGRGIGDCGSEQQWVWDGTAFRLVIARVMTDCRGVPFDDWPMLYEARVR